MLVHLLKTLQWPQVNMRNYTLPCIVMHKDASVAVISPERWYIIDIIDVAKQSSPQNSCDTSCRHRTQAYRSYSHKKPKCLTYLAKLSGLRLLLLLALGVRLALLQKRLRHQHAREVRHSTAVCEYSVHQCALRRALLVQRSKFASITCNLVRPSRTIYARKTVWAHIAQSTTYFLSVHTS